MTLRPDPSSVFSPSPAPAGDQGAPLRGVRVLDLTRLLPGPMCTLHLADLGAEVIKIEDTGAGDYAAAPVRTLVNRNKLGLRLDLKQPAGRALLLRLAAQADVLVEGFRPGVMDRLGVGYEAVAAVRPAIVYCSITGYGQTGPWRDAPGHDMNYTGWTGVAEQMGSADAPPALSNLPVGDLLGGSVTGAMGILAALFDAQRTGRGRHVDIAIADGALAHAVLPLAAVNTQGRSQPPGESKLTGALPCYSVYRTADGRHLAVAALEHKFWERFCQLIGRPEWAVRHMPRQRSDADLWRAELAELVAADTLATWTARLEGSDCCVSPILKLEEALDQAHFAERGMVLPLGDEGARQLGCPVRMSGFDFEVRHPAPRPGEHTARLLQAAGLAEAEIAALQAQGVVG